jgi:hypothetical protein
MLINRLFYKTSGGITQKHATAAEGGFYTIQTCSNFMMIALRRRTVVAELRSSIAFSRYFLSLLPVRDCGPKRCNIYVVDDVHGRKSGVMARKGMVCSQALPK